MRQPLMALRDLVRFGHGQRESEAQRVVGTFSAPYLRHSFPKRLPV